MDLSSPRELREELEKYSIIPKKSLGQNFIIDKNIINKVIDSSNLSKEDNIIEIGAGVGTLTKMLSSYVNHIYAVEKDKNLIPILQENLKENSNITIINEDILSFNTPVKDYKIIGNIPYYITSPIIRKFLEEKNTPSLIILMIQKEVAQRIMAEPPRMNLLAVSVQFYADAKIMSYVSENSFWPTPKVKSSILRLTPNNFSKDFSLEFRNNFFKVLNAGFSNPRKQLINNLSNYLKKEKEDVEKILKNCGLSPKQRAETLTLSDWTNLTKSLRI